MMPNFNLASLGGPRMSGTGMPPAYPSPFHAGPSPFPVQPFPGHFPGGWEGGPMWGGQPPMAGPFPIHGGVPPARGGPMLPFGGGIDLRQLLGNAGGNSFLRSGFGY